MLKKPRSLVESCCPYGSMVPRFTMKVEAVHFVETAVLFCRTALCCVVTFQQVATVSRQSNRQDNLESCFSQPTRVVCVNHLFH